MSSPFLPELPNFALTENNRLNASNAFGFATAFGPAAAAVAPAGTARGFLMDETAQQQGTSSGGFGEFFGQLLGTGVSAFQASEQAKLQARLEKQQAEREFELDKLKLQLQPSGSQNFLNALPLSRGLQGPLLLGGLALLGFALFKKL